MESNYELTSKYMSDLKKLLNEREISPYDIAHASFRKNNSHWVIKNIDKIKLSIKYLNGDEKMFQSYNQLTKEIEIVNAEYKKERRKYIKKYYKIINAFTKHRKEMKRKTKNTISNTLTPEQVRALVSKI